MRLNKMAKLAGKDRPRVSFPFFKNVTRDGATKKHLVATDGKAMVMTAAHDAVNPADSYVFAGGNYEIGADPLSAVRGMVPPDLEACFPKSPVKAKIAFDRKRLIKLLDASDAGIVTLVIHESEMEATEVFFLDGEGLIMPHQKPEVK